MSSAIKSCSGALQSQSKNKGPEGLHYLMEFNHAFSNLEICNYTLII